MVEYIILASICKCPNPDMKPLLTNASVSTKECPSKRFFQKAHNTFKCQGEIGFEEKVYAFVM